MKHFALDEKKRMGGKTHSPDRLLIPHYYVERSVPFEVHRIHVRSALNQQPSNLRAGEFANVVRVKVVDGSLEIDGKMEERLTVSGCYI